MERKKAALATFFDDREMLDGPYPEHWAPGLVTTTSDVSRRALSYPQRHDNVFIVVGGFAGDGHLGLGVGVFEFECYAQGWAAFADADLVTVGFFDGRVGG